MSKFPRIQTVPSRYLEEIVRDADARTMNLTKDLDDQQLIGPRMSIVNPMLWEIGHIGWFCEKFILRDRDHLNPIIKNIDDLYDSMAVAHSTRWDLALLSREETIKYRENVRESIIYARSLLFFRNSVGS